MTALSPAGAMAREGDPWRFRAALFAAPEARERLFALICLNAELEKIAGTVSEPMLGEIRLAWWLEGLDELYDSGVARGHPALEALAADPPDRARLTALAEARRGEILGDPVGAADIEATDGALAGLLVAAVGGTAADQDAALGAGFAEGVGRRMRRGVAGDLAGEAAARLAASRAALKGRFFAPLLSAHVFERELSGAGAASPFREQMGYLWRGALRRI